MRLYDDSSFAEDAVFDSSLQRQQPCEKRDKSGIVLKYEDGEIFTDISDNHTLIFGNTGSKKTRNFCIPSVFALGAAGESMILSDPKGEIYKNTSGYLNREGYHLIVINFRQPELSNFWNPLKVPYYYYTHGMKDKAIEFITDLAVQLKRQIHSDKDAYWEQMAVELFVSITLMLFESAESDEVVHLGSIQRIREYLQLYDRNDERSKIFWDFADRFSDHELIRGKLKSIVALKSVEKTLNCVISTFDMLFQKLCINNEITAMMSMSDFEYDEIYGKKTAVYIIMPDEKKTFHFLVSVFVKQCYEFLIHNAQKLGGTLPIRVNYILDEFSNLSQIEDMSSMISAARSRNIRFILVVQSAQQLSSLYQNEAATIKSNCQNWVFLASRELELLKEVSQLCGEVYIEGRGYRPLLGIMALQGLQVGWEDSEALILRNHCRPYIAWVKDFACYPQAKVPEHPIPQRPKNDVKRFSLPDYMIKVIGKRTGRIDSTSRNDSIKF